MAIGWFLVPYRWAPNLVAVGVGGRYCALVDYGSLIAADGGGFAEVECLGPGLGAAVAKVKASAATLTTIAADVDITRVPVALLDSPLSTLTAAQKSAVAAKLQALGYTLAEVQAAFPAGVGAATLRDVLRFALTRRLQARYDPVGNTIVCDGAAVACAPVEQADGNVA